MIYQEVECMVIKMMLTKYSWDIGKIIYKTKKFSKNGTLVSSIDEEEKEVFG